MGTGLAHRLHQSAASGSQCEPIGDDAVDHRGVEILQKRDALAQCWFKGNLAIHRTGGDRRHPFLQSDFVGEFVDAFLVDHGRIHVGD